ncbi:MAG: amidophosphoribosyltransferase [Ruminococcaceae bacterium]|nr:amidophosphoribosyltransferase [Oscillospiraceae bacterium]
MSNLHEECGIFGVFSERSEDVAALTYYGLYALQHRGQESCGIVVNDDGVMTAHKDVGLVGDVFTADRLDKLGTGNMAVGHCRYGADKFNSRQNCQPVVVNHMKGCLALAHNGSLTNAYSLRETLEMQGAIFHSSSDAELIACVITQQRIVSKSIEEAVCGAMDKLEGAYSIVVMSPTKLIAARDPHGFRPLCYGRIPEGAYIVASESCALETVGAHFIRDIRPGEILMFSPNGITSIDTHCEKCKPSPCIFEYIYFARPDSVIDGVSVHQARKNAGALLAKAHPAEADVVIGVPDSGIDAAIGYAEESGIPYGLGFIKNKYIGRTFISPGQKTREHQVRIKLNPLGEIVRGKRVVLIDDSIVRGTICAHIVHMLREAGAAEVHMRVSSPPFIAPCYYGTDIDSKDSLVAVSHTIEEIRRIIGVDSLGYLPLEDLPGVLGNKGCGYCNACFTEQYPTAVPDQRSKNRFEQKLNRVMNR